MFGKLMSIPDNLMWNYYELVTDRSLPEIADLKNEITAGRLHPIDLKMRLGEEIVAAFHGAEAGRKAADHFRRVFRERQPPAEAPTVKLTRGPGKKLTALLVELGLVVSKSEAERLIKQGGVEVNEQRVDDFRREIDLSHPAELLLRAGKKKFLRVVVE
jgi:tyrosyl-tRNA synthetase